MTYPDSFLSWWNTTPTFKAYKNKTVREEFYSGLMRISFDAWKVREPEINFLKAQLSDKYPPPPDLFEQVQAIISEKLPCHKEAIMLTTNFVDHPGADSLDLVELTMAFEDHFNIELPDEDIKG